MTNIVRKGLNNLNRYVTGAAITEDGIQKKLEQGNIATRTRDHFRYMGTGAESTFHISNDLNNRNPHVTTTGLGYSRTTAGDPHVFKRSQSEPDAIAPASNDVNTPVSGVQGIVETRKPVSRVAAAAGSKEGRRAKSRKQWIAGRLRSLKGIAKAKVRQLSPARRRVAAEIAEAPPRVVRAARNTGEFKARLARVFKGASERDLDTLNTRLDILKNLGPTVGYLLALEMLEALSKGCKGNAELAIRVMQEMERCRVDGKADSIDDHDPTRSALRFMSCLRPWLVDDAPRKDKHITDDHVMNALSRTAALLSNVRRSDTNFKALCIATGIISARSIRNEIVSLAAAGDAGPHQLDLTHPAIGKHLVLIACQGLQHSHSPHDLGARVIGHARKALTTTTNHTFMEKLRQGPPAGERALSADSQEIEALKFRLDCLVGFDTQEQQDIRQRNDALKAEYSEAQAEIKANPLKAPANPASEEELTPEGIGEEAYVDLLCWLDGMRSDKDIDRRGRKHKELAQEYLICDEYANHPGWKYLGPFKSLVGESSALYALFALGDKSASKKHLDEVRDNYYKEVTKFLNLLDEHFTPPPNDNNVPAAPAELNIHRLHHLLLKTAHDVQVAQQRHLAEQAKREKNPRRFAPDGPLQLQYAEQTLERQTAQFKVLLPEDQTAAIDQAELLRNYCDTYAPALSGHPPQTIEALIEQLNLLTVPVDHVALANYIGRLDIAEPKLQSELHGLVHLLDVFARGKATRGAGHIEDICRFRQIDALYKQDNTILAKNSRGMGVQRTTLEIPLAPVKGAPKATVSGTYTVADERQLNNWGENHGGLRQVASGKTTTRGFSFGVLAGEKVGVAELTSGIERGYSRASSKIKGVTTTFLRHARNTIVDGVVTANGLAQEHYGNLGSFGAFRVREVEDEAWHAELARNPDSLSLEELRMRYPEDMRLSDDELDELRQKETLRPRNLANLTPQHERDLANPHIIKPFTGTTLTAAERRALRDPENAAKLERMDGRDYFRRYYRRFGYHKNTIALTESRRDIVTDKRQTDITLLKAKVGMHESARAEVKANITHTHTRENNDLQDVQGALNFKHFVTLSTDTVTAGVSAVVAATRTVTTEENGEAKQASVDIDGVSVGYTRRIGYSLKRRVVKVLEKDGKTTAFHCYSGYNVSSFDQCKRIIMADREKWTAVLTDPNNGSLEEQLEYLKDIDRKQTKQYVIRYRLLAGAGIKLDEIKGEIRHTENAVHRTLHELKSAARGSRERQALKTELANLRHTLSVLQAEELDLLGNGESWEPFGLGALDVSSKSTKSSLTVSNALPVDGISPLKVIAGSSEEMSRIISSETAWLKSDGMTTDARFRNGRKADYLTGETALIETLCNQDINAPNALKTVLDGLGGLMRSGTPSDMLTPVILHAVHIVNANPNIACSAADRATLCRHLLALDITYPLVDLITNGFITLKDLFEQAVRSKRISVVEWLLLEYQGQQQAFLRQQPRTVENERKAERWNMQAALNALDDKERLELLYGVMVRDTTSGARDAASAAPAGLLTPPDYDPTVWQARTTAVAADGAAVVKGPRGLVPPTPAPAPADDDAADDLESEFHGIMVDALMDHGHVNGRDLTELFKYRPDPRTLDLAMTQAIRRQPGEGEPDEDRYSVPQLLHALKEFYGPENSYNRGFLSDNQRDVLEKHIETHYGIITSMYLFDALKIQSEFDQDVGQDLINRARCNFSLLCKADAGGFITMFEMGAFPLEGLLEPFIGKNLTDQERERFARALLARQPQVIPDTDLQSLLGQALRTGSTALLDAVIAPICTRLDALPENKRQRGLYRFLRRPLEHANTASLPHLVNRLFEGGQARALAGLLRRWASRAQEDRPAYALPLLSVLCAHPVFRDRVMIGNLTAAEWARQN